MDLSGSWTVVPYPSYDVHASPKILMDLRPHLGIASLRLTPMSACQVRVLLRVRLEVSLCEQTGLERAVFQSSFGTHLT